MQSIKDMIFKSLHENLLKKKINKSLLSLEAQNRAKPSPIKTLGCIVDPMFPVDVNNFINPNYNNKIDLFKKIKKKVKNEFFLSNIGNNHLYFEYSHFYIS